MNTPNLPTDNLYKFKALAGLLVCIVAFIYPFSEARRLLSEQSKLVDEVAVIALDINRLVGDGRASNRQKLKEIEIRNIQIEHKQKLLELLNRRCEHVTRSALVVMVVAFLYSWRGFYLRYDRLQKYLDIAVKRDAGIKS